MTYYADLTAYEYNGADAAPNVLNVGWLSAGHCFERAEPTAAFVAALRELVAAPTNLFRGSHLCEFCPAPPILESPGGLRMIHPAPGTTGNGEIRVMGDGDVTYVAPTLILHYVEKHHYAPPREFVRAVLNSG